MTSRSAAALLCLAATLACAAPQTPTQAYLAYREAFAKAQKLEDVFPLLSKKGRAEMEEIPADQRSRGFEMMKKAGGMKDLKVTKEEVAGDQATVKATGVGGFGDSAMVGTITLVKDGGAWKIEEESWISAEAAALKEASCAELVAMIKDESKTSRFMEINALKGRECPEAVPVLAGLTSNFFQMTQMAAIEVLASMGAKAKSAVPALEAAAQAEKNPDVKQQMLEAIKQIGG